MKRAEWMKSAADEPIKIPFVVAGEECFADQQIRECVDPNRHKDEICVARYALAAKEDAERAIKTAKSDPDGWRDLSVTERHEVLSRVAMELRKARGTLIGAAAADTGKVFTEYHFHTDNCDKGIDKF